MNREHRAFFCLGLTVVLSAAGCSGSGAPTTPPAQTQTQNNGASQELPLSDAASGAGCPCFKVLYNFLGQPNDGYQPGGRLTLVNGGLYGTTGAGGPNGSNGGDGTFFSVTTAGAEKDLYNFGSISNDGYNPNGGLVYLNGTFYGTTYVGGQFSFPSDGTVFSVTPAGAESVLWSFGGSSDAANPNGPLTPMGGVLYGTAQHPGQGSIFSVTTAGDEKVLHVFGTGMDGQDPGGKLLDVNGVLYGTTSLGGSHSDGTVYKITSDGSESVVYNFGANSNDGTRPFAGLTYYKGLMYGTTGEGGTKGDGTIFSLTTAGSEQILYNFGTNSNDGNLPDTELVYMNGSMYGTSSEGGTKGSGAIFGYNLTTKIETPLHQVYLLTRPSSPLLALNGKLYGTLPFGGSAKKGNVFSLVP